MQAQKAEGTKDLIGSEMRAWQHMQEVAASVFEPYGFEPIETPAIEQVDVFVHGIGQSTDVVRKEMFRVFSGANFARVLEEGTDAKIICAVSDGFFGLFEGFRSDADDLIRAELGARACGGSVFLANVDTICVERKGEGDVVVDDKWHVVFMAERLERFCILARFAVLVAVLQHGSATGENSFCARQERFSLQVVTIGDHI